MSSLPLICFLGVILFPDSSLSNFAAPKAQVYSRAPGHYGVNNTLICHVSGFYPPELKLELLQNGVEMPNAEQTDLAFEEDWYYHLTKHANFIPEKGHRYSCRVTHLRKAKTFDWEPDS